MEQNVSDLKGLVAEFREMLPAQSETAQAIDDGYIEFAYEFSRFMEICLRRST